MAASNPAHFELHAELLAATLRLVEVEIASQRQNAIEALRSSIDETEAIGKHYAGNLRLVRLRASAAARLADLLAADGQSSEAEAAYGRAIAMLEPIPITDLSTSDGVNDLTGLYDKASRFLNEHRAKLPKSAHLAYTYALRRYEALQKLGTLPGGDRIGRALGDAAWYALFAHEFEAALSLSARAISAAGNGSTPVPFWIMANKAHATMFLGRRNEARELYERHMEEKEWRRTIQTDFQRFTDAGLHHPQMKGILDMVTARSAADKPRD
jgi:tetratricopeptide (TPR) repeat protein